MLFKSCCKISETATLLALGGNVYFIFVTFPCVILGQVWYLIVSFPDLCHLSHFVFVMPSRLFSAALWSLAGKGLTSWLLFVMFNCTFVTFQCGILGLVWYLIVLIPDFCPLSYFNFLCNCTMVGRTSDSMMVPT